MVRKKNKRQTNRGWVGKKNIDDKRRGIYNITNTQKYVIPENLP